MNSAQEIMNCGSLHYHGFIKTTIDVSVLRLMGSDVMKELWHDSQRCYFVG